MPDLTVSPTVDAFMAATTPAEAREAIGAGAKLLCTVKPIDPGAFFFTSAVNTVVAFDDVTQAAPIYDPLTGIFTFAEAGIYHLSTAIDFMFDSDPIGPGPIGLTGYINGNPAVWVAPGSFSLNQYVVALGETKFTAAAGDTLYVGCYLESPGGTGAYLNPVAYSNYLKLYKL